MIQHRSHLRAQIVSIAVMDIGCLVAGMCLAIYMRIGPGEFSRYLFNYFDGWVAFFASVLVANYTTGNYGVQNTYSRFNLLVSWLYSVLFAVFVLSLMSYSGLRIPLGRGLLAIALAVYSVLAIALKLLVYHRLFRSAMFLCRVIVLGTGRRARSVRHMVEGRLVLPAHKVIAFVRLRDFQEGEEGADDAPGEMLDGVPVIEADAATLEPIVLGLESDLLVMGLPSEAPLVQYYAQLCRLRFSAVEVVDFMRAAEIYQSRLPLECVDETSMMEIGMHSAAPVVARFKRIFDVVFAILAGVVFLPLAIVIAVVIKLSEPRAPVLYSQQRGGLMGAAFRILKFRTMRVGAETGTGAVWATPDDRRVTAVGRFLRRTRLDEIPQVLNILRGEMSLVGPRPERPEFIAELEKQIPFYSERANVMPGLTGWAQIRYPYGGSVADAAHKLEYDLYYIKHLSLSLDLQILLSTLRIVVFGAGKGAA